MKSKRFNKQTLFGASLAMFAYCGLCFGAGDDLPTQWTHLFGYIYIGPTTPLDKPSGERQIHWIFNIWVKEAFLNAQGSGKGPIGAKSSISGSIAAR